MIQVLKSDGASLARQEASELLEKQSGSRFGYQIDKTVTENKPALQKIDGWWKREGSKLNWESKIGKLRAS